MGPWAGLSWQELGLWRKGLLDHEGHVPLSERRCCTRQNKRGINTLTSPLLAYSSASYWMNPPRRQLAKDPGRCNSLSCRAEEGRNGKWIWELAGKLYHTAHGSLEIALISEHPSLLFLKLKSRRNILVWAMVFIQWWYCPYREHGKYLRAFVYLFFVCFHSDWGLYVLLVFRGLETDAPCPVMREVAQYSKELPHPNASNAPWRSMVIFCYTVIWNGKSCL